MDTGVPGLGCYLVRTNQDKAFLGGVKDKTTTNWNYFSVFYDTSSFQVSEYPDHGIWLTPVSTGGSHHFVIAGLPVVAYPRGSANPDAYADP